MGSLGTGIGETLKKKAKITPEAAAGAAVGGPLGFAAGSEAGRRRIAGRQREEAALRQALTGEARAREARAEETRLAAEESVRQQKAKARRQRVFAGQDIRESLFRKALGGSGQQQLGV